MNKKLLSITIPTWNRSKTLDKALSHLLPQISVLKEYVELIISDNCSTDNTKEVIQEWRNKYKEIDFITFYQTENTGFFGNFRKCKELATGKFFWILSDDDFIQINVLETIINFLKNASPEIGLIYLNSKENNNKSIYIKDIDIFDVFYKFNHDLTLTSSVIFYNNKQNDDFIFKEFYKSNLIGFALLVDVIRYKNKAVIFNGYLLSFRMDKITGYNIFDAFVFDICKILSYMPTIGYSKKIISKFKEAIVKKIWVKRYFYLKAKGKMDAGLYTYPLKEVNKILKEHFSCTFNYWVFIFPLMLLPTFIIKYSFPIVEKLRNFIRK
ncbi:MAG: glycosyltransferase family 2 protein [Bacteroidales bacterium]|jgi:glycosyltransferase involved in cell wall biosynthesis